MPRCSCSPAGPQTSTGSRRPAFARLHSSVGMSPTWSACRCDKNTLVVAVTGSPSPLKLASEPEPRSKKKKSPSTLPTSMSSDADAWLFFTNGSPLPRIVTRISSTASGSVPGTKTSAYCPCRGTDHGGRRDRQPRAFVCEFGHLIDLHHQLRSFVVRTPVSPLFASTLDHITDPRIRHMGVDRRPTLRLSGERLGSHARAALPWRTHWRCAGSRRDRSGDCRMMRSTWLDATWASTFAATWVTVVAWRGTRLLSLSWRWASRSWSRVSEPLCRERSADAEGAASVGTDIESIA